MHRCVTTLLAGLVAAVVVPAPAAAAVDESRTGATSPSLGVYRSHTACISAGEELVDKGQIDGFECYTFPFTPFWWLREAPAG